jgi:hypothetical protein
VNLETTTVIRVEISNKIGSDGWSGLKDTILRHPRRCWDPELPFRGLGEDGNGQERPGPSVGAPKIVILTIDEVERLGW